MPKFKETEGLTLGELQRKVKNKEKLTPEEREAVAAFGKAIDPALLRTIAETQKVVKQVNALPDGFLKQVVQAMRGLNDVGRAIQLFNERYTQQVQQIVDTLSKSLDGISKAAEWLERLDKAGLTPNLGEDRSIRKLKQYEGLLKKGYAIFWVPRAEIIDELTAAKNEPRRKRAILSHKTEILEDCSLVLDKIKAPTLKNYKLHLQAAIESMSQGNTRSAQSAASICFDALLDQIIDASLLTNYREIPSKLRDNGTKLKAVDDVPIHLVYAALQSHLIVYSLRDFDRLKPRTAHKKYGRHSSAHTVSAKQYNEFNALQAIMIATSLFATTAKLGKGWLTNTANYIP